MLVLTRQNGILRKIALTYSDSDNYRQGYAPYADKLIAEIPGRLIIFTDTFVSNVDEQGECGASPTGERFLHVVSLTAPARETFSLLIDSCWVDIEPKAGTPTFDRASMTLTLNFDANNGQPLTAIYHIADDNTVGQ